MHAVISFARNVGEQQISVTMHLHQKGATTCSRGCHSLGCKGRRSLITSNISLIAYSIADFPSSSVPNFLTSISVPFPGKKKKHQRRAERPPTSRNPSFPLHFFIRKQGERRENKENGMQEGRTERRKWGGDWSRLVAHWTRLRD